MSFDLKYVFNQQEFMENEDSTTDFFKDFFLTRTWMVFLENKIYPQNVQQVQTLKQFDECIKNLEPDRMFHVSSSYFSDDLDEEKEKFEYLFSPDKYLDKTKSFQEYYINTIDVNGLLIENCIKTIEIQRYVFMPKKCV